MLVLGAGAGGGGMLWVPICSSATWCPLHQPLGCCSQSTQPSPRFTPPTCACACSAADSVQKGAKKLGSKLSLKRGGSKDRAAGEEDAPPSPAQ